MNDREIFENAIIKFGAENQIDIAIEEMSELTKALLKARREKSERDPARIVKIHTLEAIYEEIADVEIMLEQLQIIYKCFDSVEEYRTEKIKRLGILTGLK